MRKLLFSLCLCVSVAVPAWSQFVGFVGLQTTQQTALNAVSAPTTSVFLRNVGQTSHLLTYTTSTTCTVLRIFLEGSFDGATFVQISNTATDPASGTIFASGYYPIVRANLQQFSCGGGTLTARYSATNAPFGPPTGQTVFAQSVNRTISMGLMDAQRDQTIPAPEGHSGGVLLLGVTKVSGLDCSGPAQLKVQANTVRSDGIGLPVTVLLKEFPVSPGNDVSRIDVPSTPAETIQFTYLPISVANGANCNLFLIFGSDRLSNERRAIDWRFLPATAAGIFQSDTGDVDEATGGVPVQLLRPSQHTVQLSTTGGPATCTFLLEGSLDDQVWFDLSGAITCTSSTMFHVVNKPVNFIRGNLTALTGGTSPTVTFHYVGRGE